MSRPILVAALCAPLAVPALADPLPSWDDAGAQARIVAFVDSVTEEGGAGYVEPSRRIAVFDNDGNVLRTWGEEGDEPGQLNGSTGLTFDADDNLWVVNGLNSRIQKFTSEGVFVSLWGTEGAGDGYFRQARAVAVASDGSVYVADYSNNRIQKFLPGP